MKQADTILLTGGAGYIGSHITIALLNEGYKVAIIDDLSTGFKELVADEAYLMQNDFADKSALDTLFSEFNIDTVIHVAASISVPESITYPSLYYRNNLIKFFNLIKHCATQHIKTFIFASSSAVYGQSNTPLKESHALAPVSPYGSSKLMAEQILRDTAKEHGFSSVSLRYFNVAGADSKLRAGDLKENSTSIINRVLQCVSGQLDNVSIFGTDYATHDGTAMRDYIHVSDIAEAHLHAIKYAQKYKNHSVFNLGLGTGHSVQEIINSIQQLSAVTIPIQYKARRPGDPTYVVADPQHTHQVLGFRPKYTDLDQIISDALAWKYSIS